MKCGGGIQTQVRECTNPAPAYGGKLCAGASYVTRNCNSFRCPGKSPLFALNKRFPSFREANYTRQKAHVNKTNYTSQKAHVNRTNYTRQKAHVNRTNYTRQKAHVNI